MTLDSDSPMACDTCFFTNVHMRVKLSLMGAKFMGAIRYSRQDNRSELCFNSNNVLMEAVDKMLTCVKLKVGSLSRVWRKLRLGTKIKHPCSFKGRVMITISRIQKSQFDLFHVTVTQSKHRSFQCCKCLLLGSVDDGKNCVNLVVNGYNQHRLPGNQAVIIV